MFKAALLAVALVAAPALGTTEAQARDPYAFCTKKIKFGMQPRTMWRCMNNQLVRQARRAARGVPDYTQPASLPTGRHRR